MESTVADAPDAGAGVAAVPAETPARGSFGGYALAAALAAALLPTVFSPSVFSTTFTPKLAVLLVVGAVGAVPLFRLARASHITWVGRAAMAFLVVALVSALLSPAVNIGIFGIYDWGTGWLFWFGCAGAFAIGASLKSDQLTWAFGGIVFAGVANSLTALLQIADKPTGALSLYDGTQADGLLGNPIHLEAVLLGTLALIAGRASVGPRRMAWWPVVLLVSVALEFTLERVALPIMLLIIVVALVVYGLRRAAPFVVLTIAGYAVAYATAGSGLGTRVSSGTSTTTYGTRLDIWNLAVQSVVHHPILGVGPGQVIAAIAPHISASFAARLGPSTLPADSHNFLIEVLATTGVLGFVAFVAWLGGAAAKSSGPFLACAIAMLAVELIEPLNVGVTPVALLALGVATVSVTGQRKGLAALREWRYRAAPAAADGHQPDTGLAATSGDATAGTTHASRRLRPASVVTVLLIVMSLFVGITMVLGDHDLYTNYREIAPAPRLAAAKDGNSLSPYWAESAVAVGDSYFWASNFSKSDTAPLKEARLWYATAAERFPYDPTSRAELGTLDLQLGNRAAAQKQYEYALVVDPWSFDALEGMGTVARDDGDWRTSLYWYDRALRVAPAANDLANLIKSDQAHLS
ncbi:MAG: O-antigen ligase family protein [Acidimicrobiales bacterium]